MILNVALFRDAGEPTPLTLIETNLARLRQMRARNQNKQGGPGKERPLDLQLLARKLRCEPKIRALTHWFLRAQSLETAAEQAYAQVVYQLSASDDALSLMEVEKCWIRNAIRQSHDGHYDPMQSTHCKSLVEQYDLITGAANTMWEEQLRKRLADADESTVVTCYPFVQLLQQDCSETMMPVPAAGSDNE